MNVSLQDLLEIFAEAQAYRREKGLRYRDHLALLAAKIKCLDYAGKFQERKISRRNKARKTEREIVAAMRAEAPKWQPEKQEPFVKEKKTAQCVHDGPPRPHCARGLCRPCWSRWHYETTKAKRPFQVEETEAERTRRYCG